MIAGQEVPDQMPPFVHRLAFLLKLKTGRNPGKHEVKIQIVNPRGEPAPPLAQAINFEQGEDRGLDFVLNLDLNIEHEGLYWFDVYLDEVRISRTPLRVTYVMQRHGTLSESPRPVH